MIRSLLSLLLALTLATTSVSAAVMHNEMRGASQIEICADSQDGLAIITLDATGKQISHHNCPDCTAAMAAILPDLGSTALPHSSRHILHSMGVADATSRSAPTQSARDPPAFA